MKELNHRACLENVVYILHQLAFAEVFIEKGICGKEYLLIVSCISAAKNESLALGDTPTQVVQNISIERDYQLKRLHELCRQAKEHQGWFMKNSDLVLWSYVFVMVTLFSANSQFAQATRNLFAGVMKHYAAYFSPQMIAEFVCTCEKVGDEELADEMEYYVNDIPLGSAQKIADA